MRRRYESLTLLVTITALFSTLFACGGDDPQPDEQGSSEAAQTVDQSHEPDHDGDSSGETATDPSREKAARDRSDLDECPPTFGWCTKPWCPHDC